MARKGMERVTPSTAVADTLDDPFFSPQRDRNPALPVHSIDIRILELLTARLCHELSGPIAAINNGVELLAEEEPGLESLPNPAFLHDAVALVSDSARRARSRLQFYRFAYGFSSGSATAGPAPHEIAIGFFAASRIIGDYADGIRVLSPDWQKLACNLLSVGADALPRGGRLILIDSPLTLEAVGEAAALSPEAREALMLATPVAELTARTVQPYFTGLLAKALDRCLIATAEPGRVRLRAVISGDNPA
ncbi:MAG TPA: histidine phosphotransferase family protein [Stellaceae bacterium]|nr:histidine phosphotransferase family protein [Stellaceae bacterium]